MSERSSKSSVLEYDDGISRAEDAFRRATFNWAMSTKRMVDSAKALGENTKVAHAALADIEYAKELLEKLYVPAVVKGPPGVNDGRKLVTASEVRESVSGLVARVVKIPLQVVDDQVVESESQRYRGVDLSAPVWPKNGKMLWAGVDCKDCPSVAGKRCLKEDGTHQEKPHSSRKRAAEQA